jgi:hypothetical protein
MYLSKRDDLLVIDFREHIVLVYLLWLEDNAVQLCGSFDWYPLAGMS